MDDKQKRGGAGREGFGDDGGARVGRPDAGRTDERSVDKSMARLSDSASEGGLEGGVLDEASKGGKRSDTRADGSFMAGRTVDETDGQTLDKAQRAQSGTPARESGADGAEAARGVHGAQAQRGTSGEKNDRAGSEPLEDRKSEHKGSYGGEGGAARTSSDQREKH